MHKIKFSHNTSNVCNESCLNYGNRKYEVTLKTKVASGKVIPMCVITSKNNQYPTTHVCMRVSNMSTSFFHVAQIHVNDWHTYIHAMLNLHQSRRGQVRSECTNCSGDNSLRLVRHLVLIEHDHSTPVYVVISRAVTYFLVTRCHNTHTQFLHWQAPHHYNEGAWSINSSCPHATIRSWVFS